MARCYWIDPYELTSLLANVITRHRALATETRTTTVHRIAARVLDPDREAVATSVIATRQNPVPSFNIFQIIPCHRVFLLNV
jgi:hypothetical protein